MTHEAERPDQRRTVLVVEDEATMAVALRYNLVYEGYRCLLASNGNRALEAARYRVMRDA